MYTFVWRGYKACISCNLPKLNSHELNRRFDLAMEFLQKEGAKEISFKKPNVPSSSASAQSSSSSSRASSESIHSENVEEKTQIPETQYDGKIS